MRYTFNECKNVALASIKLINNLVFSIHLEQSKLFPSQVIERLGFVITSKEMIVSITECNKNDIKAVLKEVKIMK